MRIPKTGEFYRHFKNKLYQIVAVAEHSETGEMFVIYQALYGAFKVYARPLAMFVSEVDHEKYPEVTQKYRFERIELSENADSVQKQMQISDEVYECTMPEKETVDSENACEQTEQKLRMQPEKVGQSVKVQTDLDASQPEVGLLEFLDEDDWEKKYHILLSLRDKMSDRLVDNLATAIDVVIPDGPLDDRYEQLKVCVRTRQRYESLHCR